MILSRTLSRDDRMITSIATKVILQMNCKMGGELWAVRIPVRFTSGLYPSLMICVYAFAAIMMLEALWFCYSFVCL